MSQLGYRLNQMVNIHHKESSYSTRNSRGNILDLAAKQLLEGGFKLRDPSGLKTKHVNYLVSKWQQVRISVNPISDSGVIRSPANRSFS